MIKFQMKSAEERDSADEEETPSKMLEK